MHNTRDLGLMQKNGQSDELCKFMKLLKKEITLLYATCATEKAARAKSLLEMRAHLDENAA